MNIDIDIRQLNALASELTEKAPAQAAAGAHKATIAEATAVQARAKAAAPRERPWLATQGIRRKSGKDAAGSWSIVYTIPDPEGRRVAFYQEYGTSRHAPQPFMTPAIEPSHQTYPSAIAKVVDPFGGAGAGPAVSDDG